MESVVSFQEETDQEARANALHLSVPDVPEATTLCTLQRQYETLCRRVAEKWHEQGGKGFWFLPSTEAIDGHAAVFCGPVRPEDTGFEDSARWRHECSDINADMHSVETLKEILCDRWRRASIWPVPVE